jgi:hypothetical protein
MMYASAYWILIHWLLGILLATLSYGFRALLLLIFVIHFKMIVSLFDGLLISSNTVISGYRSIQY